MAFGYPDGVEVAACVATTPEREDLLWTIMPFSSGAALPDDLVWTGDGGAAAGSVDAEWRFGAALGAGF